MSSSTEIWGLPRCVVYCAAGGGVLVGGALVARWLAQRRAAGDPTPACSLPSEVGAEATFDVIVVGAGSAGGVLAARVAEQSGASVLLLEAGGDDRNPLIQGELLRSVRNGVSGSPSQSALPADTPGAGRVQTAALPGQALLNPVSLFHLPSSPLAVPMAVAKQQTSELDYCYRTEPQVGGSPPGNVHVALRQPRAPPQPHSTPSASAQLTMAGLLQLRLCPHHPPPPPFPERTKPVWDWRSG